MSCISPKVVHKGCYSFLSPCGHCSQCIASKVSALSFLVNKDVERVRRSGSGSSFVTLTYNNASIPVSPLGYPTLRKKDSQDFMKRFRIILQRSGFSDPVSFVSCGEYGSDTARPHMHYAIIGCPAPLCESVARKAWQKSRNGLIDVLPMTSGATGYICKYLSKCNPLPDVRKVYEERQIETPFVLHSQRIGYKWIENHCNEIIKDEFCYFDVQSGEKRLFPRAVRQYVESLTGVDPRPFVRDYMASIDTHGMPLDDYNSIRDYFHAREAYLKNIRAGKADYILQHCRLPPLMRSKHNSDYSALAVSALADKS